MKVIKDNKEEIFRVNKQDYFGRWHLNCNLKDAVFVFYDCCKKYQTLHGLKKHKFIIVHFWRSEVQHGDGSPWVKIKVLASLCSFQRLQGRIYFVSLSSFWSPPTFLGLWLLPLLLKVTKIYFLWPLFPLSHPFLWLTSVFFFCF